MNDRMPPIPRDQWTEAQAKAAAEFARMRGQEVFGPFALMLRSPEVMLRAAAMGDYMRYRTTLPRTLNEFIILLTARHWSQQYEWYIHRPAALAAGLSRQLVDAVANGRRPEMMSADETTVYDFTTELLTRQRVGDQTYARARDRFGEAGIVDMIGVAGYYGFLSMMMNVARTAVPEDSEVPPLP